MTLLQEVAKLGAQQSATALSTLLKMPVTVNVLKALQLAEPEVSPPDRPSAVDAFVGVYFALHGSQIGSALLILSRTDACRLVDAASHQPWRKATVLDEYARSTIREIGNILTGAFLAAVRKLMPVLLLHSVPRLVVDQWHQILRSLPAGPKAKPLSMIECELVVETMHLRYMLMVVADMDWDVNER